MSVSIGELEKRVAQLEADYEGEVKRMLGILQKVETRLIGSIEQETPGLIGEVRDLKREVTDGNKRLVSIREDLDLIQSARVTDSKTVQELAQMKDQLPKIWSKIRVYERYRYLIIGGLFVLGLLANKAWDLWMANRETRVKQEIHIPVKQP